MTVRIGGNNVEVRTKPALGNSSSPLAVQTGSRVAAPPGRPCLPRLSSRLLHPGHGDGHRVAGRSLPGAGCRRRWCRSYSTSSPTWFYGESHCCVCAVTERPADRPDPPCARRHVPDDGGGDLCTRHAVCGVDALPRSGWRLRAGPALFSRRRSIYFFDGHPEFTGP